MEYPKLKAAQYLRDFTLQLSFSDGTNAEVDLRQELRGGIFDALNDPAYFRSFSLQPQFGTIEWDNGADFAPEFLFELAKASGQQPARTDARLGSRKSA